jgi:hypothetical protein
MGPERKMRGKASRGVVRRSRWLGALGLLAFVAGVVVLPLSHLVHHRDDHAHGVAGVLRQAFALLREHGPGHGHGHRRAHAFGDDRDYGRDHGHEHGHPHDYDEPAGRDHHRREAIDHHRESAADDGAQRPAPKHGHGSLEHLDIALLSAGLFVVPPAFAAVGKTPLPGRSAELLAPSRWSPKQPRAPPA